MILKHTLVHHEAYVNNKYQNICKNHLKEYACTIMKAKITFSKLKNSRKKTPYVERDG